ncbi:MAG: hypothetical protein WD638_10160, partial [Nitriliruptoraceae bacterium]
FALTVGGFGAALTAFVVAAVVMTGLVFTAAFVVAGAHRVTVERVQAQAPTVKKWGGYLLILVGVWFLALAIFVDVFAVLFPV